MHFKTDQLKKISSSIGIILTIVLALSYFVNNYLFYIVVKLFPSINNEPWFFLLLNFIALHIVGFTVFSFMMKKIPDYNSETYNFQLYSEIANEENTFQSKKISFSELISLIFISLAVMYSSNILSVILNMLITNLMGREIINPIQTMVDSSSYIYTFVFACIITPIVEEIMFRKILINKLLPFGNKIAIIVSAFCFGLFHGNLHQIFYAFALGIMFAHISISSGTLKYAIILHIIINTLGSVVFPALLVNSDIYVAIISITILLVCLIAGTALFVLKRKVLFPQLVEQTSYVESEKFKISTSILSPGMIFFWISIAALVLIRTFVFNF